MGGTGSCGCREHWRTSENDQDEILRNTHVANSNKIRCGIHEEDGHNIVNCTKEQ